MKKGIFFCLSLAVFFLAAWPAQSQKPLSLCEGISQIASHFTKANFKELDENVATRIKGFGKAVKEHKVSQYNNPELRYKEYFVPEFTFTLYHPNAAKEKPKALFDRLFRQLKNCTGSEPLFTDEENLKIATFDFKDAQVVLYYSFSDPKKASATDELKIIILQ